MPDRLGIPDGDDLYSPRMLAQLLAVVVASSMFVLGLYLVGVIGNARDDRTASTTVVVEQMPPTVPSTTAVPTGTTATTTGEATSTTARVDTTTAGTTTTVPVASAPKIVGVSASGQRDDSTDSCGETVGYHPLFAFDRIPETAWMVDGDGVGAELVVQLEEPSVISEIGLVPGYDKFDPCTGTDRFDELRRVTSVRWTFDDGDPIVQRLVPQRIEQTLAFDPPVVASIVTMTILSTTEPGLEPRDHTAVSEVVVS